MFKFNLNIDLQTKFNISWQNIFRNYINVIDKNIFSSNQSINYPVPPLPRRPDNNNNANNNLCIPPPDFQISLNEFQSINSKCSGIITIENSLIKKYLNFLSFNQDISNNHAIMPTNFFYNFYIEIEYYIHFFANLPREKEIKIYFPINIDVFGDLWSVIHIAIKDCHVIKMNKEL